MTAHFAMPDPSSGSDGDDNLSHNGLNEPVDHLFDPTADPLFDVMTNQGPTPMGPDTPSVLNQELESLKALLGPEQIPLPLPGELLAGNQGLEAPPLDPTAPKLKALPSTPAAQAGPLVPLKLDHDGTYYLKTANQFEQRFQLRGNASDRDVAVAHYRRATSLNPKLAEPYHRLATILWEQGDITLDTAMEYCHTALTLAPNDPQAVWVYGLFCYRKGDWNQAVAALKEAIKLKPWATPRARLIYAAALWQRAVHSPNGWHMPQRSFALVQCLLQNTVALCTLPWDGEASKLFTSALWVDLQVVALMSVGRLLSMLPGHTAQSWFFRWASKAMPNEAVFHHKLGDIAVTSGKHSAAIYHYYRAQEMEPDNAVLYRKLGEAYAEQADLAQGIWAYEKAVQLVPDHFASLQRLGQMHLDYKSYISALYYLKMAQKQQPDNPYLHSEMAFAMFKLDDYEGAIQSYQLALSQGTDQVWMATIAQTLGTLLQQVKNDFDAAAALYQMAFRLNSKNPNSLVMLAELFCERGQLEAAVSTYRYLLKYDPNNVDCHSYVGYLLWQLGRHDEAIAAYEKALTFDANNVIVCNNLGVILLDQASNPRKAAELFKRALEKKPDYTLACFNLGRALEQCGKMNDAAEAYSQALTLNTGNPEISDTEILERLDRLFEVG
jgi:tetratricopeptide (TPR) repeat protein